jgi:hypothetical protein
MIALQGLNAEQLKRLSLTYSFNDWKKLKGILYESQLLVL